MTPIELKQFLQKEILKQRGYLQILYQCDSIGCSYHGLNSFLRRSSDDSVVLKVVCYFINEGLIELKGGVDDE